MTTKLPKRILACAAVVAASGCGVDLFVVEIESEEICFTERGIEIPGDDADAFIRTEVLGVDLSIPEYVTVESHLRGFALEPSSGITDLAFVHKLTLHINPHNADVDLPPLQLIDYSVPSGTTHNIEAPSIYIEGDPGVDVAPYIDSGELDYTVLFEGPAPTVDWTLDIEACFDAKLEYSGNFDD